MALMEMPVSAAAEPISPDGTYMFAQRDTCDLYLDVYDPAPGSVTTLDGKTKPTVLFMFGYSLTTIISFQTGKTRSLST